MIRIGFKTLGAYIKDNYGGVSKYRVGVPADLEESICSQEVIGRRGKRVSTRMASYLAERVPEYVRQEEYVRKAAYEIPRRGYIADAITASSPYVVPWFMDGSAMVNFEVDRSLAPHVDILEYGGVLAPKEADTLAIPTSALISNYDVLTGMGTPRFLEEMGTPKSVVESIRTSDYRLFIRNSTLYAVQGREFPIPIYALRYSIYRDARPIIRPAIEEAYSSVNFSDSWHFAERIEGHPLSNTRFSPTTYRFR